MKLILLALAFAAVCAQTYGGNLGAYAADGYGGNNGGNYGGNYGGNNGGNYGHGYTHAPAYYTTTQYGPVKRGHLGGQGQRSSALNFAKTGAAYGSLYAHDVAQAQESAAKTRGYQYQYKEGHKYYQPKKLYSYSESGPIIGYADVGYGGYADGGYGNAGYGGNAGAGYGNGAYGNGAYGNAGYGAAGYGGAYGGH